MSDKLRGALVLTVGRYGDWNADEHAIRRLVDNFNATRDRSGLSVPLILGHDAQQSFAQNSGLPALGRCTRLYVDQKKGGLRADFADVPSLILDMIRNRSYRTFSVEVDPQWEETGAFKNGTATDIRGPVLRRVALLGADVPRCRDLEDLGRLVAHAPHAEAVHCEQLADLIRVSIPAVPANEIIHLAEGSNVLLAGILPPTLQDRMHALEAAIAAERITMAETRKLFGGFAPAAAGDGQLSKWANTAMDATEAALEQLGLSRDNVGNRRKAAEVARALRPDLFATDADFEACVNDFAVNVGGRPAPVTTVPNAHGKAIGQMSEDRFLKRMSEEAQQRGWSIENAVDRNRLITILRASEPETVPLLGTALVEAQRLGGTAQYWHLREVANKLSLSLDRANDRAFAERQMYAERGRTLQTAEVYEEAAAAVIRREGLNFAEAKAKRRAAEIVFAARPDLVEIYGSGTRKAESAPTPPTPDAAASELLRMVEAECESRGLDPLSRDRRTATDRVLRKNPNLRPDYGSKGRA